MESDSVELRDQASVLRRRWLTILLTVLLAVGAAIILSRLETKVYTAEAEVLLSPPVSPNDASPVITPEWLAGEAARITSTEVADAVVDLGLGQDESSLRESVTVSADPTGAPLLRISAERRTAEEAKDVANAFALAYLGLGEQELERRIAALGTAIDDRNVAISRAQTQLRAEDDPSAAIVLRSEMRSLRTQRNLLIDRQASLLVGQGNPSAGTVRVFAEKPSAPSAPQPIRNAALAGVLGLMLGVGLAFVRDHFDDAVRDEEGVPSPAGGRPVLGRIPHVRGAASGRLVTLVAPRSPASEAYRALGANIRFLLATAGRANGQGALAKVLLVSSARPGEGKTSTAANLAVVAAGAGLRVVLVDADLRRPRVADVLGLGDAPGLSDLLASESSPDRFLVDIGVENLSVLLAGTIPPNPAELLASQRMRAVLRDVSLRADLVIVDSPALLAAADPLELVPVVDLTVLVARAKVSRGRPLAAAMQRITQLGGTVAGVVLNDVAMRDREYDYGYGTETPSRRAVRQATSSADDLAGVTAASSGSR